MDAFEVDVRLIHKDEPRETSLCVIFLAASPSQAVRVGADWAKDRLRNLSDTYCRVGSVNLCGYTIGRYSFVKHEFGTRRGWGFFEWKCDYPRSLDEAVEAYVLKHEPQFKAHEQVVLQHDEHNGRRTFRAGTIGMVLEPNVDEDVHGEVVCGVVLDSGERLLVPQRDLKATGEKA